MKQFFLGALTASVALVSLTKFQGITINLGGISCGRELTAGELKCWTISSA